MTTTKLVPPSTFEGSSKGQQLKIQPQTATTTNAKHKRTTNSADE